jgi:hypothetical protein
MFKKMFTDLKKRAGFIGLAGLLVGLAMSSLGFPGWLISIILSVGMGVAVYAVEKNLPAQSAGQRKG